MGKDIVKYILLPFYCLNILNSYILCILEDFLKYNFIAHFQFRPEYISEHHQAFSTEGLSLCLPVPHLGIEADFPFLFNVKPLLKVTVILQD